jgi:hypothetical protein
VRWPWSRGKRTLLLVEEVDVPDDPDDSLAALRRAREALREAERIGGRMHEVTGSIHRERKQDSFAPAFYQAMRRKES